LKIVLVAVVFALGIAAPTPRAASVEAASRRADALDETIDRAARAFMANGQTVALSIGVVKDGKTRTYDYGTTERGARRLPTSRTIYAVGSLTKTFTGLLLARAAVEKKLALDDDVRKYLPGDYPNLEYDGHPIRIVHLIAHSSGLPHNLPETPAPSPGDGPAQIAAREAKALGTYAGDDLFRDLHGVKLAAAPGERFGYSNAAAQLAGLVLERVYARPYDELVRTKIAGPLRMRDTKVVLSAKDRGRFPKAYGADGAFVPYLSERLPAAGSLKSTVEDLLKYAEWNVAERDAAVALAHRPVWFPIGPQDPNYGIALGGQTRRAPPARAVWQDGSVPGFTSLCVLYPELKIGLVILANEEVQPSSANVSPLAKQILAALDSRAVVF
jgi:CubicO group peptidase (beta-lactamase class C family)